MAATAASLVKRNQPAAHYLPGDLPPATPKVARRSLSATQRHALKNATPQETVPSKDDLPVPVQAPETERLTPPTPLRRRDDNSENTTTSQQRWGLPSWATSLASNALLGILVVIVLYSLAYGIAFLGIATSNRLAYGPTHTSYTHATLNRQASDIITSNVNGTVYITIVQTQQNGTAKASIYTGPALDPSAWGNDLSSIVATASVAKNQVITVNLIGNINYFHLLFARPTMTLQLIPDKQAGYKVVSS